MKRDDIIKAVSCPACGASAGQACIDNRGHKPTPRKRVHPARESLATGGKFNTKRRKVRKLPKATISADFYSSWEWKEARYAALKACGRVCGCCGWQPSHGGNNHLVVDHIKSLRTHPHLALEPSNHQVLCNDCNMGKSYKHDDDFRIK